MELPPHGGSNQGRGYREGEDIGPPETECGRAIRCNAADSGPLRGLGTTGGGGARVPQRWWEQTGIDWILARERSKNAETEGDGTTATAAAGTEITTPATEASSDSDTGSGGGEEEEEESLGASGSIGAEWSGAEAEE